MKNSTHTIHKRIAIRGFNGNIFRNNGLINTKNDPNLSIFKNLIEKLKKKKIKVDFFEQISSASLNREIYFFDVPYSLKIKEQLFILKQLLFKKNKRILFCFEPPIVAPFNYFRVLHIFFDKIYTWNDDLVDNKKYFKFYWPQSLLSYDTRVIPFEQKKFLTMINGNKLPIELYKILAPFGKELYTKRLEAIEYFEKNNLKKLDLYGRGWNKQRLFDFHDLLLGAKKYKIYKGEVKDKIKLLSGYKYCLCFENVTNVNGFITEKIFDCFKARCIPIYLGANNIDKYIPKECYIDFRKFKNYNEMIEYLDNISKKRYNNYILNIEKLLADSRFKKKWFGEEFASNFLAKFIN